MGRLRIGERDEESERLRNGDDHCGWNMLRTAFVHGRITKSNKEWAFETAIIASMLAIYTVNRFTPFFDVVLPYQIAKNHLNDACAGVLFPAYANTLCLLAKSRWRIASLRSVLALSLACCFTWEIAAPAIVPWSVGDPIDCICYIGGAIAYAWLRRSFIGGRNSEL